jgi:hypothetical protein
LPTPLEAGKNKGPPDYPTTVTAASVFQALTWMEHVMSPTQVPSQSIYSEPLTDRFQRKVSCLGVTQLVRVVWREGKERKGMKVMVYG